MRLTGLAPYDVAEKARKREEVRSQGVSALNGGVVLAVAERRRTVTEFEKALRPEHDVWTTTSGRQALDVIDSEVNVVVVTPETADMTGAELVSRTRKLGLDCRTASVGRVDRGLFDGRVPKPVTPEGISETVDELTGPAERYLRGFAPGDNPVAEDYEEWRREGADGFAAGPEPGFDV
jgi:hypothetical protein